MEMENKSIFQLGKIIQIDRERLKKLEAGILPGAPPVSDVEAFQTAAAELKNLIQTQIKDYAEAYVQLCREIDAVDDPYAKQLFTMLYVEGDTTPTIALKMGMAPTTIRGDLYRYRKKYGVQWKAKHPRMKY